METETFCGRYLKINDSTANEYFVTKFCGSFRIQVHIIWLGCTASYKVDLAEVISLHWHSDQD